MLWYVAGEVGNDISNALHPGLPPALVEDTSPTDNAIIKGWGNLIALIFRKCLLVVA